MMPASPDGAILHVLDGGCDATALQVAVVLRDRLGGAARHRFCCVDAAHADRASRRLGAPVEKAPQRLGSWLHFSPGVSKLAARCGARLVHAWGAGALVTAAGAKRVDWPLVVTVLDPASTAVVGRWMRAMPRGAAAVAASSQVVRSRLIGAGVDPQQVVVIRGPADFKAINAARNGDIRQTIAPEGGPILLMHGPASRGGGQYFGLWAAAIVSQVHRNLRIILPYDSRETNRLLRFARSVGPDIESILIRPDGRLTWAELAAAADVFVAPAVDDVCIEPLATAMAARLVIVGTAVRSVAELIADRHNGLLVKKAEPKRLAARILTAIEDGDLVRGLTEVARAQAYEVFGARRFADDYERLYDNMLAGRPPGDGIVDSAMVA